MDMNQVSAQSNIQPLVSPEKVPTLPKRRNNGLIIGLVIAFSIALILGLSALLLVLKGTFKPAVNEPMPVSNTVSTVTPKPLELQPVESNEAFSFNIGTSIWNVKTDVKVEIKAPIGSTVIENNSSHSLGYKITNAENSMTFYIPYESFPANYSKFQEIGTNNQFGKIFRFSTESSTDLYSYTSSDNLNKNCSQQPCGELFVGKSNSEVIYINCPIISKDFCDKIVLSTQVSKITVPVTTKDLSLDLDLSVWMNNSIRNVKISNVPSTATSFYETQSNGRIMGYRIRNEEFNLFIYVNYESLPGQFVKTEGSIANNQFGNLKRVYFKDLEYKAQYVSTKDIFNECPYGAMDSTYYNVNCAEQNISDGNKSGNGESIYATCESGFETCDKIISSLTVKSTEL